MIIINSYFLGYGNQYGYSRSEDKGGQQYHRGGGRVQGGWNQGSDNYQRSGGYNRGRQY